jgi:DNA processing protein
MSLLHQVALTFVKNIGPLSAKSLIAHFGEAEQIFKAPRTKLMKVPNIGERRLAEADLTAALLRAEEELRFIEKNGIEVIFYTDKAYPKRLMNCADGPILLYAKGNMDLNPPHVISIVGTRNATEYGKQLCRNLVEELQQYNALIVSGLALGIDVCAHKESLKQKSANSRCTWPRARQNVPISKSFYCRKNARTWGNINRISIGYYT